MKLVPSYLRTPLFSSFTHKRPRKFLDCREKFTDYIITAFVPRSYKSKFDIFVVTEMVSFSFFLTVNGYLMDLKKTKSGESWILSKFLGSAIDIYIVLKTCAINLFQDDDLFVISYRTASAGLCLFTDSSSAPSSDVKNSGVKLSSSSAVSRLVRTLAEWLVVLRGIAEEREADQPPVRCRCKKAEKIQQELRLLGHQLKDAEQVSISFKAYCKNEARLKCC